MKIQHKFPLGLRTVKTALAAVISMLIVDAYGASTSKLIFAMLGAMAAVQLNFKESVLSCMTQLVGVLAGALVAVLLLNLPLPKIALAGIGIVLVIVLYNLLHIHYAPGLPCLIVVILCTSEQTRPVRYALGRLWDTTIGLSVGLVINMLIFPYDNSRSIRKIAQSLDVEVLAFLDELFDGDAVIPDASRMSRQINDMEKQLEIFANQKLFLSLSRQHRQLRTYRICEQIARRLIAEMEALSYIGPPGRLTEANRKALSCCGVEVLESSSQKQHQELDTVTNYHVSQLLRLREEMLALSQK